MRVNGEALPAGDILQHAVTESSGWYCRYWSTVVSRWPPGETVELAVDYSLTDDIHDGQNTYLRGDYRQVIQVQVK
mgnify:FL=1